MKKRIVRIISMLLTIAVLLISLCSVSVVAADKTDYYELLLKNGIPQDLLDSFSNGMVAVTTDRIKNYKIADIFYDGNARSAKNIYGDDLIVKNLCVILEDKKTGDLVGEYVCIYWTWQDGKPVAKQKDEIIFTWLNSNYIYDGESFYAEDYQTDGDKINISARYKKNLGIISDGFGSRPSVMEYLTDLKCSGGTNGGCASFMLIPCSQPETPERRKNPITFEYIHYYKTTVVVTVLSVVACLSIAAVVVTVCLKKRKKKADAVEEKKE